MRADLVYASGVLYHLTDPVEFLAKCAAVADNIFLWTFVYDEREIEVHDYESARFAGSETRQIGGETFIYHKRFYDPAMVVDPKYQGGTDHSSFWMTFEDIEKALNIFGYQIIRIVDDSYNRITAKNILASKNKRPHV